MFPGNPEAVQFAFATKAQKSCGFLIALVCLIALGPKSLRGQSQAMVIEGGTLIDGSGGAPVKNSVVVIEGNRIKAAGPKGLKRSAPFCGTFASSIFRRRSSRRMG